MINAHIQIDINMNGLSGNMPTILKPVRGQETVGIQWNMPK